MKTNNLTDQVMKEVVRFEKKRTFWWLIKVIALAWFLLKIISVMIGIIILSIRRTQSLELLSLFKENWEVIVEFWQETLATFWLELPQKEVGEAVVLLVLLVGVGWVVRKNLPIIKKRILALNKYQKKVNNKSDGN